MTVTDTLDAIKKFIEDEIASQMEFQKEQSDPVEYVNPFVAKITLPHKNFMPVDFQVPFILVGLGQGEDSAEETTLSIRILCATYGGEIVDGIPDESGYEDLLRLIETIKAKLIEKAVINGAGTVNRPITYGIYDSEIVYPYWYGYVQFDISCPVSEFPLMDF